MSASIFDLVPKEEFTFAKLEKIGDSVEGTYIKRDDDTLDGYQNPQARIFLKTPTGEVKVFAIRHSKLGMLKVMDTIKLGQIIGFRFDGTKDNVGKNPTKFYNIAHDPAIVDKEWLAKREADAKALEQRMSSLTPNDLFPSAPVTPATAPSTPPAGLTPAPYYKAPAAVQTPEVQPVVTEGLTLEAKTEQIIANALKNGATDDASVKQYILDKTGLALIDLNVDLILERLNK